MQLVDRDWAQLRQGGKNCSEVSERQIQEVVAPGPCQHWHCRHERRRLVFGRQL
jgi:hypothetical protein